MFFSVFLLVYRTTYKKKIGQRKRRNEEKRIRTSLAHIHRDKRQKIIINESPLLHFIASKKVRSVKRIITEPCVIICKNSAVSRLSDLFEERYMQIMKKTRTRRKGEFRLKERKTQVAINMAARSAYFAT